jgi:signal transduction histidine kinase
MRNRLMVLLVGATIAVIALYGVPRAYFLADLVQDQQENEVQGLARVLSAALAVQEDNGIPVTESFLDDAIGDHDLVRYDPPQGTVLTAGTVASSDSDITVTEEVGSGGRLTLVRSGAVVERLVSDAILPLVLLGLGLVATSAVAAVIVSRRLSRPFQDLAQAATSLGEGRFDLDVPHSSVPEAEAIGTALRKSSTQLKHLVHRERDFAVRASHELLSPITALNLQLEDLRAWPETPPAVVEELGESLATLDHLTAAVRRLLEEDRSTRRTAAQEVDLAALTHHVVARWRPVAAAAGREIRLAPSGVIPAQVSTDEFTQVLDVLLDNACRHGRGRIEVDCADLGTHVRVGVADEGELPSESDVIHRHASDGDGHRGGLEAAAELAEAQGGYLLRDDTTRTRFLLMLPKLAV